MKRGIGKTIFLPLIFLTLWGCHTVRPTATTPEAPAAPVEPATVEETPSQPAAPRTYTVINFSGVVEGISINGQLRIAEDSIMWLSINKYIEVARGLASPDSLWLRAPLLGIDDAIDYPALRKRLHRHISFADLQAIALAENADEQITQLANQMGYRADIHITRRQQVSYLSFPFTKKNNP